MPVTLDLATGAWIFEKPRYVVPTGLGRSQRLRVANLQLVSVVVVIEMAPK